MLATLRFFDMFRLFVLILCLLLPAGLVRASSAGPVVIYFTSSNVPAEVRPAILTMLPALRSLSAQRFAVVSFQMDGDWALATVAALDAPGADPEAVGMGDGGALVVLHRDIAVGGDWQAAAEGTPEFAQVAQIAQASPYQSLVSTVLAVTRPAPTTQSVSATAVPSPTLKFPWDRSQAWYFTQGWHYGNNVDFAPAWAVANKWVLAAHGGVVTRLCLGPLTVNLRITHLSGVITEYAHLDKNTIPAAILGKTVIQGQLLGKAYNAAFTCAQDPCGYSTGPHLHFKLPSQSTTIDGWLSHVDNTWTNGTGVVKSANATFPSTNVLNQGLSLRVFLPGLRK